MNIDAQQTGANMDNKTFAEWRDELQSFADQEGCSVELAGLWSNRQLMKLVLEAWNLDLEMQRENAAQKAGLISKVQKTLRA